MAFVSEDDGESWHSYARSRADPRLHCPYAVAGARHAAGGRIVGAVTDRIDGCNTQEGRAVVYFIDIEAPISTQKLTATGDRGPEPPLETLKRVFPAGSR